MRWIPQALVLVSVLGAAMALADSPDARKQTSKGGLQFQLAEWDAEEGLEEASVPGNEKKVYLHPEAVVTNRDIASVRFVKDSREHPAIELVFTDKGSKKLAQVTSANLNKPLAIVLDGKVLSAPTIRSKIAGKALITGHFSEEEVKRICESIRKHIPDRRSTTTP